MSRRQLQLAFGVEPSDRQYRLRLARYPFHASTLAEELPESGPAIVLDAGCGKGRLPLYWKQFGHPDRDVRLVGIDISDDRLGRSAQCGYDLLIKADLSQPWPIESGRVSAVLCEQVLEHLDDQQVRALFGEIRRVLEPNGFALVGAPVFTSFALAFSFVWMPINRWLHRIQHRGHPVHLQHLTLADLERRLEECGFEVEDARGFRLFSLPTGWLEDRRWYYQLHQWLGRRFPSLCAEVTVTVRKV